MATIDPIATSAESLAEARAYLRLEDGAEDALLARLIAAATALCEGFTGIVLIARAASEMLPARQEWRRLTLTPVLAITGVAGQVGAGDPVTLAVDGYALDIDGNGDGWVRTTGTGPATRVTVHYTAGLADAWPGLPEPIRQGIVRLAAHFFSHRDAAEDGGPPAVVAALWRPWRRVRLR